MPRYAFPPIPIRLPLSEIAALAEVLALSEARLAARPFSLPALRLAFCLPAPSAARALTTIPGNWTLAPAAGNDP